MARGGARPGAGRKADPDKAAKTVRAATSEPPEPPKELKPLDYMLGVMNDPRATAARRDRMAVAAAPFVHPRVADNVKGKKDQADEQAHKVSNETLSLWGNDLQPRTSDRMN